MTPREWLDLIEEKARQLRAAGVKSVRLEGCFVTLSPPDPDVEQVAVQSSDATDPLNDPSTFGGVLPGWPRLHDRDAE